MGWPGQPHEQGRELMDTIAARPEGRQLGRLEIGEILKCLPHRYPFLMIDRIIDIDGDESAIGIKNVTVNEPIFQGHFPENPVFPGVLIIEGMAQTAGAMVIAHDGLDGGKGRTIPGSSPVRHGILSCFHDARRL